jgi:hypothetical protein
MFQTFCYVSVGLLTVGLLYFLLYIELRSSQVGRSEIPRNVSLYSDGLKFFICCG